MRYFLHLLLIVVGGIAVGHVGEEQGVTPNRTSKLTTALVVSSGPVWVVFMLLAVGEKWCKDALLVLFVDIVESSCRPCWYGKEGGVVLT